MGPIKITKEKLNLFCLCGKAYLNMSPKSKLWYAVDKVLKKALKLLKKVEEEKNTARREFALKKDKGVFDTAEGGVFQYSAADHEKLIERMSKIDEEEVEIMSHIIPVGEYDDDPKVLSFDMRNAFEGIVIPEINYDEFDIDKYEAPKEEEKTE